MDILAQSADAAKRALDEEPDAFTALARYLHDAIDLRIGVVMPMLARRVQIDDELAAAHFDSQNAMDTLVKAAHDEESLRPDVGAGDIGLLMDGLLRFLAVDALPGRPLSLADLNEVQRDVHGNFTDLLDDGADCYWRNRPTPVNQDRINSPGAGNEDRRTTNDS